MSKNIVMGFRVCVRMYSDKVDKGRIAELFIIGLLENLSAAVYNKFNF